MQFTVLIEFLVPGLATTLLALFLLPAGTELKLPPGLPTGETASALLLLAVSYPVGILVNYPLFEIQRRLISVMARRSIATDFEKRGFPLETHVTRQFRISSSQLPGKDRDKVQFLFHLMSAHVFSKNIERQLSNHVYHEGLQRLTRGILPPLLLAIYVLWIKQPPKWGWLVAVCVLLSASACALLNHSVRNEYRQIARYFLVLTSNAVPASATADEHRA